MFMAATLTMAKPPGLSSRYISAIAARSSASSSAYNTSNDVTTSKDAGRKGDRRDARAREARAARLTADLQAGFGQVEAERAAERAEQFHVRAGAASAVEQERTGPSGDRVSDERRDECAKPAEPEMTRFRDRGRAQQMIHAAHCTCRYSVLRRGTCPARTVH